MAPAKSHVAKKQLQPSIGYPLPSSCSVSSLNEFLTDGNASFLRAARSGNVEKIIELLKGNIDINTSNANGLNALHLAAKEGNVNVVIELLKRGANVNAATKKGNTALHIASLAGQEEVVKVLIQLGANVNVQSQNGFTPLYMAAQENHDSVVSFLLAHGANQSLATEDGFTPLAVALQQGHDKVVAVLLENDTKGRVRLPALHIAAKKDDCKAATLLLQSDHNPDVTSKSGFTPLHIAAHYGNENIAKILLSKGADVNYAAKHQITPLHVASKWGKMNMVVLLLEKGANIEASTRDGLTPLHCAARSGHDQVVDLLLEKGAPFLAKTKNGLAPLHMASQGDHVDSARILLYHKAPVDDVTVDYLTALHVAAHCGHVKVAKLLLDRKADPNARALNGFTPLHIACKKNRIKVVELLLKHGASIEATTESGLTPLHVASFMGCMNIVIYLIQNGANPDVPTVRGETPLHLAARANQTDIIRILLRNGASVDARAREEQTPLHIAARLGNVDIVSLLLQHGAAVDATTKDMYTALHIAAKEDQEEVASSLLDHGASLTSTTKKGFTPLHLAAKYGNIKVARLLIQKEAPVDAQGKNGVTPLHVAAHYDHVNVALLLLDKGASPHAMAKNGYTPLHIAAKKNQMDIASTLLEYGAKTNSESKAGFTPLHLSSQEGHADMSSLLIENKADVNHKANNGLTPLHLCAQDDRVNVAHLIVRHKAEIAPQTKAGYTPLHVACHFGQINMVRFLLQNNANVHTTTSHGYTPLHQAAQQGHTLVVNLLLENQASPNVTTMQGQTPLSIAQRLGYISVVETLKVVTETTVTTTTTTVTEEKYKVVAPETMQETFMTDSEDEGGADFDEAAIFGKPTHATHVYLPYLEGQNFQMSEEAMLGDQSYGYLTADEMKSLGDDSLPIDVTKDEKHHDIMHSVKQFGAPMVEEDKLSPQHGTPVESGFSEKFSPDNIDLTRVPVHAGSRLKWKTFLVSFMVDARGGAMRGCRHSGVRVIIPPRKASMPMRITCRYLRKEKLIHPPPLMEGEACASRILEMGPVGARFLGPVIIEVPHFASTRGKEREITILRSDTGESWREHTLEASEEAVQEVLNESFEGEELSALEDLNTNRITRILTTDFPQYFAIITRVRQEVHGVGPEGGMVSSTVVPQVQAIFPEGALTKKIRVGLQAQPIAPELVAKLLGNRVAVSPIVTVEPRRRKFHKPITLTIPVPQAATKGMINQYSGDAPTLRLLCSITGGSSKAQWEDVTGSTPLTFVNDCVSFTTTVSARFWLMDCRQVNEVTRFATELYQEAVYVPFMSKFVIFAKRYDPYEAQLRVFCMTDDKEDKTLECQENFTEVAKSRDVEVLEGKMQYLEFAGNIAPVTKSGEQLKLAFQAFHENRLPFTIRVKDPHIEPMGRIAFMREPKAGRGEPPQIPICNLNVALPDIIPTDSSSDVIELVTLEKRYDFIQEAGLSKPELIHRADLRLSDIAQGLDKDWVLLAQQLDVSENDISQIKADATCDQSEQALMMLRLWLQKSGSKATGNELEKGLRKINREDIIKNCMFNVELVTDDVEKAVAKVHLDQSGFDVFKEELGSSREASMRRGASLDISYDEQDIMKEAESAAETSSETGSLFERDQISQALTDDKELKCQKDESSKYDTEGDVSTLFPKCKVPSSQQCQETVCTDSAIDTPNALSNKQTGISSDSKEINLSLPFDISSCNDKVPNNEIEIISSVPNGQDGVKLHEFWPPNKILPTQPNGVFSKPTETLNTVSEDQCSISLNSQECTNKSGTDINNITNEKNLNFCNITMSESKVLSTDNTSHKVEGDKSIDACDLGYCSMDKDSSVSPTFISESNKIVNLSLVLEDNSQQNTSEPQADVSPCQEQIIKNNLILLEQTPNFQLCEKENSVQSQPMTVPVTVPIQDACVEKSIYPQSPQNFILSNVSTPESTKSTLGFIDNGPNNVCTTAVESVKGPVAVTASSSDHENSKPENYNLEDARIRRASKTPPPSPVDEVDREDDNVDRIKEKLFSPSALQDKLKEDIKGPVEVEQKLLDTSGRQEIPARLTESETWPSLELDTSQVSISSLPEDEKSEPTTATVSDAVALAADTDEPTEDGEIPRVIQTTRVIQSTTVTTVQPSDAKSDEASEKKLESLKSDVQQVKESIESDGYQPHDEEKYPSAKGTEVITVTKVITSFGGSLPTEVEPSAVVSSLKLLPEEVDGAQVVAVKTEERVTTTTVLRSSGDLPSGIITDDTAKLSDELPILQSEPVTHDAMQRLSEEKTIAGMADMSSTAEHAQQSHVESILTEDEIDQEFVVDASYSQSVEDSNIGFVPCAFVNTAFAGAELIDKVDQASPIRARSPYEVIRDDQSDKADNVFQHESVEEETEDRIGSVVRTTYVTKHTEMRHRPLLQNIPSEISEEDLVEREISSPVLRLEAFGFPAQAEVPDRETHEEDIEKDQTGQQVTIRTITERHTIEDDRFPADESHVQEKVTTEEVTYDSSGATKTTVTTRITTITTKSTDVDGSEVVGSTVKLEEVGTPESDTGLPTSPLELGSEIETSDVDLKSGTCPSSLTLTKSEGDKSHDSVITTTISQTLTEKTISTDDKIDKPQTGPSPARGIATEAIDSSEEIESRRIANGPGEVEYQPEYDYGDEYAHSKWPTEPYGYADAPYSDIPFQEPSTADDIRKSRYSSVSDDVVDYEIGEILKSEQQFEDIIERPMTPEPPVDGYPSMGSKSVKTKALVSDLKLDEYELKEKDDSFYDDGEPISSPALSPDDSRSGFAYGMQFEKDILNVTEEAMDIDSDPYSEEKDPAYAYGMRYERDAEDEDVPCYGDLYTHEEEDEDALENGDKVKIPFKPKKEPEFDILAGRKYFSKNVEIDELSVSSLQEFEHLEAEIVSGRKSSVGSVDSLNGKHLNSKSGDHDDVSMSSLTEFERLERECLEVEKIDPAMQESITQLSEIEEGHESQASETSQENKSDGCKDEDLSIMEDFDHHLGDIDNIILKVDNKDELPFQYLLKQVPKPSDVFRSEMSRDGDKTSEVLKTADLKTEHTSSVFSADTCMLISQQSQELLTKSDGKSDDIDQDSLRDEISLKPDSLAEDTRHEYLDSLHEGKCDDADSLQGDIPDEMRDSLLEERHLEDDSLHEMDILPDESSLSMESSFAAAISHDSSKAEDHIKGKKHDGAVMLPTSSAAASSKDGKVEIIVSELPKCDIMLSSTDSLEQSSSAAAAFHFESESAMSTSLTGALASEDNTMISSTDTLEHEGRITFRYEDIPVDDLEILVRDGRKVIVDSEGNIQTEFDMRQFLDSEDNLNNDFNLSSKDLTEIKLPSTSTVHVQSSMTSVSYSGETDGMRTRLYQPITSGTERECKFESSYPDPDVEVEEIHTTDEFGNPKVIKKIRKVIQSKTQFSSSSSSENVEEKLKEFLREHGAGENAGLGEEVVQEERSLDEKGNVVLVRTVKQQILSEPEVHSRTFTGPDAAALSEEYVERFKDLDPTDDVCEFEKIDDQGNVVRVTQQIVIKPEVHSVSFSGPDAHQQMEEYMKRFTSMSQNGDGINVGESSQSFSTVRVSTTTEQFREDIPSESVSHDLKSGTEYVQTTTSSFPAESSEQIVHTTTTTCTSISTTDGSAQQGTAKD